ncbi:hypothetical protein IB244_17145 [Rhizobium sp. RHZ02]|uniref:hypothetical protein n=1 Tax=Rhizobium sp. RHZ02 TaxID=2769306 RepID=UPI00177BA48C|nr:hypothetical protein [Rhizobium sp. RHZ02]MBD9453271.1 hypothetical protein [Rhizobium sp. RHZ02]
MSDIVERLRKRADWRQPSDFSEAADEITRLRSELANARNAALEEAAKEIEHLSPTTHVPERLSPVTDDYGEIVGHFVSPAGVRKRFITGERAAKAIRSLKAEGESR